MTHFQEIYQQITNLKDLSPSKEVNKLFSRLVKYSLDKNSNYNELANDELKKLQHICSIAEYKLEKFWSKKIITSSNPSKEILKFPYYSNYVKLTQMEWFSLLSCSSHSKHKALFIGGGPLPLTAIVLANNYVNKVVILEVDKSAYELSVKLIDKLNLSQKIKVELVDAVDYKKYKEFNLIFVAALAGVENENKRKILRAIKNQSLKGTHILGRSAWGSRKILYKEIDLNFIEELNPIIEVRPHNEIVNSVFIFSL